MAEQTTGEPSPDHPLDREWLRDRLLLASLAGGPAVVHRHVAACLAWLQVGGITTRGAFEAFMRCERVQGELRDAYRTVLRRRQTAEGVLGAHDIVDPLGLCQWGPMLYRFRALGFTEAAAALRALLADYPEAVAGLKRVHAVDRDANSLVYYVAKPAAGADQAAAHLGVEKDELRDNLIAVVSRSKRRRKSVPKRTKVARKR
jgi:hypothetical protein